MLIKLHYVKGIKGNKSYLSFKRFIYGKIDVCPYRL